MGWVWDDGVVLWVFRAWRMTAKEHREVVAKARKLIAHAKSISETVGLQAAVASTGSAKIAAELKGVTTVSMNILDCIAKADDMGLDFSKWVEIHERTVGDISQILEIASSLPSVHLLPGKLVEAFPGLKRIVAALEYVRRKSLTVDKKERWRMLWLKKQHEKNVLGEAHKKLEDAEKDLEEYKAMVQRAKRAAAAARDILTLRVTCESRIPKCNSYYSEMTPRADPVDCCSSSYSSSVSLTTSSGSGGSFGGHEYPNQPTTPPCTISSPLPNFIRKLPAPPDLDRLDSRSTSTDEGTDPGDSNFDAPMTVSRVSDPECRSSVYDDQATSNREDLESMRVRRGSRIPDNVHIPRLQCGDRHRSGECSPSTNASVPCSEMPGRHGNSVMRSGRNPPHFAQSPVLQLERVKAFDEADCKSEEDTSTPCLQTDFHCFDEEDTNDIGRQCHSPESSMMDSMAPSPQTKSREEAHVPTWVMSSEAEASVSGPLRISRDECSVVSSTSCNPQQDNRWEHTPSSGNGKEISTEIIVHRPSLSISPSIPASPPSPPVGRVAPVVQYGSNLAGGLPDAITRADSGDCLAASPSNSQGRYILPSSLQGSRIGCPSRIGLPRTPDGHHNPDAFLSTKLRGSIPLSPPANVSRGTISMPRITTGAKIPSSPVTRDGRSLSLSPGASKIRRPSNLLLPDLEARSSGTVSPSCMGSGELVAVFPSPKKQQGAIPVSPSSLTKKGSSGTPVAGQPRRGIIPAPGAASKITSTSSSRGLLQVKLPAAPSPLRTTDTSGTPFKSARKRSEDQKTGSSTSCPMIRTPPISNARRVEKSRTPSIEEKKLIAPEASPATMPLRQRQQTIVRQAPKEASPALSARTSNSLPSARKSQVRQPPRASPRTSAITARKVPKSPVRAKNGEQGEKQCHLPYPYIPQLELESQLASIFLEKKSADAEEPPACVIISGSRGSGKSMLATHFLNGAPARQHYDGIFWLNASELSKGTVDAVLLLREFYDLVIEAFGEDSTTALGSAHSIIIPSQDALVFKISCLLKGRRVFLVLDDVVDNHVHLLGIFLKLEISVLVTTCHEVPDWKVRRFHSLVVPPLLLNDAERLFWRVSMQATRVNNSISKEVIHTCAGHPLLLCVAGALLSQMVKGGKIGVLEALCTVHGAVKGGSSDAGAILYACLDELTALLDPLDRDLYLMMAVLPYGGYASREMLQNLWALENISAVAKKTRLLHSCFLVIPEDCSDPEAPWGLHNVHMKYVRDKVATRKDLQVKMEYRQQRYLCKLSTIRSWFPQKRYKFARFWDRVGGGSTVERLLKRNLDELKKNYSLVHMIEVFMYDIGAHETAERLITLVMLYWSKSLKEDDIELAIASTNMGFVRESVGDIEGAEEMHRSALSAWSVILGNDDVRLSMAMSNLGSVLVLHGGIEEAERLFRDSLSLQQAVHGLRHPDALLTMSHLGKLLIVSDRLEEAERLFLTCVSFVFDLLGGSHPYGALVLKNLGLVLNRRGKIVDAEQIYRSALSLLVNTFGDMHPEVAMGMSDLGCFLEKRNRLEEAEKLHKIALAILKRVFGINNPEVAASMCNLGAVYARLHKFEDAEEMNRRALFVMEGLLGNDHPDVVAMRECVSF